MVWMPPNRPTVCSTNLFLGAPLEILSLKVFFDTTYVLLVLVLTTVVCVCAARDPLPLQVLRSPGRKVDDKLLGRLVAVRTYCTTPTVDALEVCTPSKNFYK